MSFLGELKRRKIFQVAAVYAVTAWLLVQIVVAIEEPLNLPDWMDAVVIVLLAVGFPITLIISWSFNLTSEGLVRDSNDTRMVGQNTKAIEYALISLLTIAVGWLLYRDLQGVEQAESSLVAAPYEPGPVVRFPVPLPTGQRFNGNSVSMMTLSPDGTKIAYAADDQIFLRNLNESTARPIPGTNESGLIAATPAFSPDGQFLVFVHTDNFRFGRHVLKRVPISGGMPLPLYESEGDDGFPHGLSWPTPDTIIFAAAEGIVRLPANGGGTRVLVQRDEDERIYSPQLLPGGEALLFTRTVRVRGEVGSEFDTAEIVMQSIDRNDGTVVLEPGSSAHYLPSGHLVFAQGTQLFAIAFDMDARTVRGAPVQVVQGLRRSPSGFSDTANFVVSASGTLAMLPGTSTTNRVADRETTLVWVDRNGQEIESLPIRPDDYLRARISPDGSKIALVTGFPADETRPTQIWIFDLTSGVFRLLTSNPSTHDYPVWSSDSARLFFASAATSISGAAGIYSIDLATGETEPIWPSPDRTGAPWSISPDDETLALVRTINSGQGVVPRIFTVSVTNGEMEPLFTTEVNRGDPEISPNGTWVAYHTFAPGIENEIQIVPLSDPLRTQIPVGVGLGPVFSSDGQSLFFSAGNGSQLLAASIAYDETGIRVNPPEMLFESTEYQFITLGRAWDVHPDGEQFLMIRRPPESQRIDVTINWLEELERRVPIE